MHAMTPLPLSELQSETPTAVSPARSAARSRHHLAEIAPDLGRRVDPAEVILSDAAETAEDETAPA